MDVEYKYFVTVPADSGMEVWCYDNCDGSYEISMVYITMLNVNITRTIKFEEESDAMAFKLRWT